MKIKSISLYELLNRTKVLVDEDGTETYRGERYGPRARTIENPVGRTRSTQC